MDCKNNTAGVYNEDGLSAIRYLILASVQTMVFAAIVVEKLINKITSRM